MAPPDNVSGVAKARLYISEAESSRPSPDDRAQRLARKLDERLKTRLDQIRGQMSQPAAPPNSEWTGTRVDILA
jgi:hypothetical protein